MNGFSVYGHYRKCGYQISKEGHKRVLKNLIGTKEDLVLQRRVKQSDLIKLNAPCPTMTVQEQLNALVKNLPSIDLYVKACLDYLVIAADPSTSIATAVSRRYNKSDIVASRTFDDAMHNLKLSSEKHGSYLDSMVFYMIEEFILSDNRACFYPIVATQYAESVLATNNATTFALEQELMINLYNRFADYREIENEILTSFRAVVDEFQYDYKALTDIFYLVEKVHKLSPYLPLVDKMLTMLSDTMFELSENNFNKLNNVEEHAQ